MCRLGETFLPTGLIKNCAETAMLLGPALREQSPGNSRLADLSEKMVMLGDEGSHDHVRRAYSNAFPGVQG